MGTTLANLHVYNVHPESVKPFVNKNFNVLELSEGWTSILGISLEDADKEAGKLSKNIGAAVLSFMYFDDDLMSLKLFKNGKRTAHYEMFYEREPYLKGCREFLAAAGFDSAMETRLRKILRCEDLGRKVEMLEEFFGISLYIDPVLLKEEPGKFQRTRGDSAYRSFDEERRRLNKIKNKTKAVLTQEIEAKLSFLFTDMGQQRYFVLSMDNSKNLNNGHLFELAEDELKPVAEKLILPGDQLIRFYKYNNEFLFIIEYCGERQSTLISFTENGTILGEARLPEEYFLNIFLDNGDMICTRYLEPRVQSQATKMIGLDKNGNTKWSFDTIYPDINPVQNNAHIYFGFTCRKDDLGTMLYKLSQDGNVVLKKEHKRIIFDYKITFIDEYFYCYGYDNVEGSYYKAFFKVNEDLEIVDRLIFPEDISPVTGIFNEKTLTACYHTLEDSIIIIDLATMEYKEKKLEFEFFPYISDDNGNIYGTAGKSTLIVLDQDLNLISRHRLKGSIERICKTKTGIHTVTATGNRTLSEIPEPECVTRVYRIDPS